MLHYRSALACGVVTLMFSLYRFITDLAAWPLRAILRLRSWQGKEEPLRLAERRGISEACRPDGPVVWCHAASVGEAITFLPIITRLLQDAKVSVLLTTGTVSSARLMAERLPENVIHQFAPWDRRAWIARFLNHWQPDVAVRMESELWPNTLSTLRDGDVPVVVVNGRLSEKSVRGWQLAPKLARDIFACLTQVLAQTPEHADRFTRLGARHVDITGNLKLAAPALPVDEKARANLSAMIGPRPVWLAASTHPGEEDIALEVHKRVAQSLPNVLTIIAPRHAQRGAPIAQAARHQGLAVASRSGDEPITSSTDVYVADTFGELGVLFSLCPVVFIGKSLTVHGGQNPIEPTHFDCAILFGPHMENFGDLATTMVSKNMALQVNDAADLACQVEALLQNPEDRTSLAGAARTLVDSAQDSLEKTITTLFDLLETSKKAKVDGQHGR